MSDEQWTQDRIDRTARSHLLTVAPLVEVLGGSDDDTDDGYVEVVDRRVQLTTQGQIHLRSAREIVWESAGHLGEILFEKVTGHHDGDFLERVQALLALTAHAMEGAKDHPHEAPDGLAAPWTMHVLYRLYYRPLLEHPEVAAEEVAHG